MLSAALGFVIVILLYFGLEICKYRVLELAHHAATESASLACSRELSRIVIDDPHFGFVALSEQPAGSRTRGDSGDPVPIKGINSITATLRQNQILASALRSDQMASRVEEDRQALIITKKRLIEAWQDALLPQGKSKNLAIDANGKPVHLLDVAIRAYKQGLGALDISPKNFSLELLSLNGGGPTITTAPGQLELGKLKKPDIYNGCYVSDKDLAVDQKDFYMAATAPEARMVDLAVLTRPRNNQLGSIVKLTAAVSMPYPLRASACAIPPSYQSFSNRSTLVIGFPAGAAVASSVADLLSYGQFANTTVLTSLAKGGDYPIDTGATLSNIPTAGTASSVLADCIYDFLRSSNKSGKETLSSIIQTFQVPFVNPNENPSPIYYVLLYFDDNGSLKKLLLDKPPVNHLITSEEQPSGCILSYGLMPFQVRYLDESRVLSTKDGGKHGGKPLSFSYLNYSNPNIQFEDEFSHPNREKKVDDEPDLSKFRLASEIDIMTMPQVAYARQTSPAISLK
jgi:hypothetical protein